MKEPEKLIVKFLSNTASDEEIDRLYDWLASDTRHQKILTEYMNVYNEKYRHEHTFDASVAFEQLNQKITENVHVPWYKSRWYSIAAVVSILIVAVVSLFFLQYPVSQQQEFITRSNPNGTRSSLRLSDGSLVLLNAGSSLKFPEAFSSNSREVYLQGEAFFEVSRNELKPFIVHTGSTKTQVLGTSFNIYYFNGSPEVSVATGKVAVSNSSDSITLVANEQAYFLGDHINKREILIDQSIAWKNNELWFDNAPIDDVVKQLTRWYGVEIDTTKLKTNDCHITGRFKNEKLSNVLEAIKISTGIKYEKSENKVVLKGKGCE